jgi:hypothetical protein
MANQLQKQQVINELYRRGNLLWKCHAVQKEMYNIYYNAEPNSTLVWLLSRQSGKSTLISILAIEHALRKPHSIIKILTDTKVHAKNIYDKIFQEVLSDCPADLKPEFLKAQYLYEFPNGSQIQLAGSDSGHFEKLRGQKSVAVFVDEAGFCNELNNIVKDVLLPTTTHTGGKIVLASTPPENYDHDLINFIDQAKYHNYLTVKTIDENPLMTPEKIARFEREMGGRDSERFKREYLCMLIKNTETSVLPEFTEELAKELVKEWPTPPHRDCYVSMDLGGKDLTFVVFGYFDFRANKIIIEDELVMDMRKKDNNIKTLMNNILDKELALWKDPYTLDPIKPYVRVSDINPIVTKEIYTLSDGRINFMNPNKTDKIGAIHDLRVLLQAKRIIIHPRCANLVRHLENVRWTNSRSKTDFARSADDGHYDGVDALIYFIKSIVYSRNPYPSNFDFPQGDVMVNPRFRGSNFEVYRKIFNLNNLRKR